MSGSEFVELRFRCCGNSLWEEATVGVSVMRLGVDGIPDTRNAWEDRNNNGLFDSGDYINPDKISYFNSADWAVYFTYAQRTSTSLMYGFNLK